MRRIAIIPARGGSKRLPRKNILPLAGRPMIAYPIAAARDSGLFSKIIVSTEDDEIARVAAAEGAEIAKRPADLAGDRVPVVEVCFDVLRRQGAEKDDKGLFCCIYATAAFLTSRQLVESERLMYEPPLPDVVMGVSEYPTHPYQAMEEKDGFLKPLWPVENKKQSQDWPAVRASNGTIYWARIGSAWRETKFYVPALKGYNMPPESQVDIDTPEDYERAKELALIRLQPQQSKKHTQIK